MDEKEKLDLREAVRYGVEDAFINILTNIFVVGMYALIIYLLVDLGYEYLI